MPATSSCQCHVMFRTRDSFFHSGLSNGGAEKKLFIADVCVELRVLGIKQLTMQIICSCFAQ